nr:hypothetical protein [Eubacteriales bacterium]
MKKNAKSKNYNSAKSKKFGLYKLTLCFVFAILILLMLDFSDFFIAIHKLYDYSYVMPTKYTNILSYIILFVFVIVVIVLYDKLCIKKTPINILLKHNKKFMIFLSVILLGANILCYFSYYYIDKTEFNYTETNLLCSEKIFSCSDVEKIDISIENAIISPTGATPFDNYFIICTVYTNDEKVILESENFYSYSDLYDYLSNFNCTINVDKSNLDELLQFENGKPFSFKGDKVENIKYIKKYFL